MEIYFPITANILTVGHIKCLQHLRELGRVTCGLLTSEALNGYKEERQPYKDREYILKTVAKAIGNIAVVPQDSLNPKLNCIKYNATHIASGDGFEMDELQAIKELKLIPINIRLDGEDIKTYSSSKI